MGHLNFIERVSCRSFTHKLHRNKILTLSRLNKKLYRHNVFELNMNNINNTWKGINLLINRRKKGDINITTASSSPEMEGYRVTLLNYPIF